MKLTLSVSLTDESGKDQKLGSITYSPDPARPGSLEIREAKVEITATSPLTIKSGYDLKTSNLTVVAFHEDKQVLLGLCHWDRVTPYFGFRVPDVGFVHLNFKKTETAGVPSSGARLDCR